VVRTTTKEYNKGFGITLAKFMGQIGVALVLMLMVSVIGVDEYALYQQGNKENHAVQQGASNYEIFPSILCAVYPTDISKKKTVC